jgi:hypothetical protein
MQDTVNDPNAAEGFQPHDPRGIAGHAWYEATAALDPARLPGASVRRLLAEALEHVRLLLDSSDEAGMHEDFMDEAGLGDEHIEALRVVKPGQAEVLASALADAIAYQTPEGFCRDCEDSRSALCGEHAGRRRAAQVTRTGRVHRMAVRKIAHPSVDDRKARGHGGRPGADAGGRTGGAAVRTLLAYS